MKMDEKKNSYTKRMNDQRMYRMSKTNEWNVMRFNVGRLHPLVTSIEKKNENHESFYFGFVIYSIHNFVPWMDSYTGFSVSLS